MGVVTAEVVAEPALLGAATVVLAFEPLFAPALALAFGFDVAAVAVALGGLAGLVVFAPAPELVSVDGAAAVVVFAVAEARSLATADGLSAGF